MLDPSFRVTRKVFQTGTTPPGDTMENARRQYGLSEKSPLLTVPVAMRIRCQRGHCPGSECGNWHVCGPASPFGNYFSHLPHSFVTGHEAAHAAAAIPA
jgi:hypothetical protein